MTKKQIKKYYPMSVNAIENIVEKGVNPEIISELKMFWHNEAKNINTKKLAINENLHSKIHDLF